MASAVVGILRAMLTADTAQHDTSMRKSAKVQEQFGATVSKTGVQIRALTPQAERMVKAFGGDKLLYQANNITAAVTKLGGAQKLTAAEQAKVNGTLTTAIAKYQALGKTAPQAMLDLERATRKTSDAKGVLNTRMVAIGAAAGTMAAQLAGQAIRQVISLGKEALDTAGHLVDLSNQTGLSTRTLQRMDAVAGQTGQTLDVLTNASFKLQDRIAGGGDSVRAAFDKLGLSLDKLQKMQPDEQWEKSIIALGKVKDANERNAIAVELFGIRMAKAALAIAKDYESIAGAAKLSTDEQLQQLDVVGDRLDKLSRDFKTTTRSIIADAAFMVDEFRRLGWMDLFSMAALAGVTGNVTRLPDMLAKQAEARARAEAQRKKAAEDATAATQNQTKAEVDYVKVLALAEAELKKLDATERRQIDAAQKAGEETEKVEELLIKFGVSAAHAEVALKLYNGQMKAGESAAKAFAKSQKELNEEAARAAEIWFDVQVQMDRAMLARQKSPLVVGDLDQSPEELIDEMRRRLEAVQAPFSQMTVGDLNPLEESVEDLLTKMVDDLEAFEARGRQFREFMGQLFAPIFGSFTDGIGSLLFGGGDGNEEAKRAKAYYEELKRSGTASAEAITRAYLDMRREQSDSESRWDRYWQNVKRGAIQALDQLFSYIVNQFLGGLIKKFAASMLGERISNFVANALGFGGSVAGGGAAAAGAVGAAATGTSVMAGASVLNTAAAGGTAAGGGAAAGGLAAAAPFAVLAAPLIAAKLGGFFEGPFSKELVDRLVKYRESTGRPALSGIFDGERLRSFSAGGFVPPNAVVPAVLHGGSMGEAIVPLEKAAKQMGGNAPQVIHHHAWNITAWDAQDVRRGMKQIIKELKFEALTNEQGLVPALSRAQGLV